MSNIWRTGLNPQKADKGLRGIGLFVILIAFLVASNRFVSGGDKAKKTTPAPARPIVVQADQALQAVLPQVDRGPQFRFVQPARPGSPVGSTPGSAASTTPTATSTSPTTPSIAAVASSDVVVTSDGALMTALVTGKQCAPAVTVATDHTTHPARTYLACAVLHGGQVTPAAQTFIGKLTGLSGRVVLLNAGLDLPARQG